MNPELASILESLYVVQGLTLDEIGTRLDMSAETVRRALIEADIRRRPRGAPAGKYLPNNGETVDGDGYHLRLVPGHPYASGGYVRLHRLVMEAQVRRYLEPAEVVAHKDGDRANNSLENLQLFASMAEFARDTLKGNSRARGDLNNPKRRVRRSRSSEQMLFELSRLRATLDRGVRRSDLVPPWPSYRAIARKFGSWQLGVSAALERHPVETSRISPDVTMTPSIVAPTHGLLNAP